MSMPLAHPVTSYPSPSAYPQVHSLVGLVFIPVLPLGSSWTFFFFFLRFHIYVLAYCICFSLSDLLHSVWQTLTPSTSLQIPPFRFFLWLSNIPLYIWQSLVLNWASQAHLLGNTPSLLLNSMGGAYVYILLIWGTVIWLSLANGMCLCMWSCALAPSSSPWEHAWGRSLVPGGRWETQGTPLSYPSPEL